MLLLKRTALVALLKRFLMTWIRFVLMLYFIMGKDKVCADVVLFHGCPQSCMPNPFEGLLEVYEDLVEVLLMLEIFLT